MQGMARWIPSRPEARSVSLTRLKEQELCRSTAA